MIMLCFSLRPFHGTSQAWIGPCPSTMLVLNNRALWLTLLQGKNVLILRKMITYEDKLISSVSKTKLCFIFNQRFTQISMYFTNFLLQTLIEIKLY